MLLEADILDVPSTLIWKASLECWQVISVADLFQIYPCLDSPKIPPYLWILLT